MRKSYTVILVIAVLAIISASYLFIKNQNNTDSTNRDTNAQFSYKVTTDSSGMSSKTSPSTYSGTTKVEIYMNGQIILSLSGSDGVGSNPYCDQVVKFSDTDTAYIDNLKISGSNIKDLSQATKVDFNLLGRKARISGSNIYFNKSQNTDNSKFNADCGFSAEYVKFPNIKFNITSTNGGGSENLYKVESHLDLLNENQKLELGSYLSQLSI